MNLSITPGIYPIIAVVLLFQFVPTSQNLIRPKRDSEDILQILELQNYEISELKDEIKDSRQLLQNLKGLLNSIGFGSSGCGDGSDGWSELIGPYCIKVIEDLHNFNDANAACRAEFNKDTDINYPRLVFVDTAEKQAAILDRLASFPGITSTWIEPGSTFSNWTTTGTTPRNCTELLNNSDDRGSWTNTSCLQSNSIICEKTASLPYSQVIQSLAELKIQNTFLKTLTELQSAELKGLSAEFKVQAAELKGLSAEFKVQAAGLKALKSSEQSIILQYEILGKALKTIKNNTEALDVKQKLKKTQEGVEALRLNRKLDDIKNPLEQQSVQLDQLQTQLDLLQRSVSSLDVVKPNELKSLQLSTRSQFQLLKSNQSNLESQILALKSIIVTNGEATSQNFKQLESMISATSGVQTDVVKLQGSVSTLKQQDSVLESQYKELKGKGKASEVAIDALKTKDVRLDVKLDELVEQDRRFTTDLTEWKAKVEKVYRHTTGWIQMYSSPNHEGTNVFTMVKGCINVKPAWVGVTQNVGSVNTHNSCVKLYRNANCAGDGDFFYPGSSSPSHNNYGKNVESIHACTADNQVPL